MEITTYAICAIGLAFFVSANLTMVAFVREVFSRLNLHDQASIRRWYEYERKVSTRFDRAVHHVWSVHTLTLPKSHKRVLFATFLISAALSLIAYPLCLAFGPRWEEK